MITPTCFLSWLKCTSSYTYALFRNYIDGFVQDGSNSIANTMELLQSCTKLLITHVCFPEFLWQHPLSTCMGINCLLGEICMEILAWLNSIITMGGTAFIFFDLVFSQIIPTWSQIYTPMTCIIMCSCIASEPLQYQGIIWNNADFLLTHWGRATPICVGNLTFIGSDNGLSPGRCQAIIWTNAWILLTGPLWTNFSKILIKIPTFSLKKMHLKVFVCKMAAILSWPQCVNSLWISGARVWQGTGLLLAHIMAPNHYLRQCWLIISHALWHLSEGIIIRRD